MGKELVKAIENNPKTDFVGGFEHSSNPNIGKSIGEILSLKTNFILTDDPKLVFEKSEVIIDFTTSESTINNLDIASKYKIPLVIGTTGLTKEANNLIKKTSSIIPIVYSENMSIGVNILTNLVERASSIFSSEEYDVEILERHHRYKIDAPSGTALSLGKAVSRGREEDFNKIKIFDRTSQKQKRQKGDIGFSIVRAGEITGDHKVSFIGNNDEIHFFHTSRNRSIFINGALKAAFWLANKKPGIYSLNDVIGI